MTQNPLNALENAAHGIVTEVAKGPGGVCPVAT